MYKIKGKDGLFKIVVQNNAVTIVESLENNRRYPIFDKSSIVPEEQVEEETVPIDLVVEIPKVPKKKGRKPKST